MIFRPVPHNSFLFPCFRVFFCTMQFGLCHRPLRNLLILSLRGRRNWLALPPSSLLLLRPPSTSSVTYFLQVLSVPNKVPIVHRYLLCLCLVCSSGAHPLVLRVTCDAGVLRWFLLNRLAFSLFCAVCGSYCNRLLLHPDLFFHVMSRILFSPKVCW